MITIGFLELNSIAKGILAADEMIKTADIRLIAARPSCPGKYQILITGEVSSVEAALDAGQAAASANVIDRLILPRVHPQVIEAISMSSMPERLRALGVMEFFSVTSAVMAADAAAKAADVTLLEIRMGTGIGGKSFVTLTGDVSAVTASVEAGCKSAEASGMLLDRVVIAHPDRDLYKHLL
ncbi:BMC domain-containing protein [Clostridium sp. AM29-11AC]|uniref:BMC domain-containing protein n=1 Tax=Clostridium sp. AM29-11AC TaxID=2293028 RepID=UPI0001CCD69D|nr:BMC domain-containing protein [Clostridium sp. AM29-11AC]RHT57660.1 BMC domain-containing protein [Clostridium sp. AM29-11AC]CBK77773.1 Carbon dioxide concentrating mechanism/carboxysome shell protein [[Clostridium] cf. saccharolyticum K10]